MIFTKIKSLKIFNSFLFITYPFALFSGSIQFLVLFIFNYYFIKDDLSKITIITTTLSQNLIFSEIGIQNDLLLSFNNDNNHNLKIWQQSLSLRFIASFLALIINTIYFYSINISHYLFVFILLWLSNLFLFSLAFNLDAVGFYLQKPILASTSRILKIILIFSLLFTLFIFNLNYLSFIIPIIIGILFLLFILLKQNLFLAKSKLFVFNFYFIKIYLYKIWHLLLSYFITTISFLLFSSLLILKFKENKMADYNIALNLTAPISLLLQLITSVYIIKLEQNKKKIKFLNYNFLFVIFFIVMWIFIFSNKFVINFLLSKLNHEIFIYNFVFLSLYQIMLSISYVMIIFLYKNKKYITLIVLSLVYFMLPIIAYFYLFNIKYTGLMIFLVQFCIVCVLFIVIKKNSYIKIIKYFKNKTLSIIKN